MEQLIRWILIIITIPGLVKPPSLNQKSQIQKFPDRMQKVSMDQSQAQIKMYQQKPKQDRSLIYAIIIINILVLAFGYYLFKSQTPKSVSLQTQTQPQIQRPFVPVYIWQGPIPEKHMERIQKMRYPFRIMRNCDKLLSRMQQQLGQKFTDFIYNNINQKTDVCKYVYLYYQGGFYIDLDTELDYQCMKNFVKDQKFFFQQNQITKGMDLFAIYSAKPKNPDIKWALSFQNTLRSYNKYFTSLFTQRLPRSAYNYSQSGCVKHFTQRTWLKQDTIEQYTSKIGKN